MKHNKAKRGSLMRILKATISSYKLTSFFVLILIIASAIANVYGSLFMQKLVDDYITPLLSQKQADFTPYFMLFYNCCVFIYSESSVHGSITIYVSQFPLAL